MIIIHLLVEHKLDGVCPNVKLETVNNIRITNQLTSGRVPSFVNKLKKFIYLSIIEWPIFNKKGAIFCNNFEHCTT